MLYLIGETDVTAVTAVHKSHINAFIKDITNAFPFSWNMATDDLTLAAGVSNLPTDYNPNWHLDDVRITGSSTNDDNVFTEIDIKDRDKYGATDYKYWITWDATNEIYVFNTLTQTGTVTIYYYFEPADLSGDTDVCVVPDGEAVAYGGASKNYIGDDENVQLKQEYEKEAASRIQRMYNQDLNFGPKYLEYSKVSDNSSLTNRGV